jgi:rare lipoprotein A
LWEEALRQRPWPRFRPNGQPNGQPSGSAPLPDPDPDDGAASNPLPASVSIPLPSAPPPEDPDPYRVLPPTLDMRVLAPYLQGVASWYGPTFHGKPTANGEIYNQYGLTAAHPVLPIGTKIQVENLENQRKVWVRVNDRGPYAKGRVLDLSKIAAQRLGMIENGTAQVRITVLSWPDTVNPNLGLKAYTQYVVQAAAYPDLDEAESLRERLQARFPQSPVMIDIASNGFFAVVAGPFDEEAAARQLSRQLQRDGITNLVRRYRN